MSKFKKIILIGLAGVLILCGSCWFLIHTYTAPYVEKGNEFLSLLKNHQYAKSFDLLSPGLKEELRNADTFQAIIEVKQQIPLEWSISSREYNNGYGQVSGPITYANQTKGTFLLGFHEVDGQLRISKLDLTK